MAKFKKILFVLFFSVSVLSIASFYYARNLADQVILVLPRKHHFYGQFFVWHERVKPSWRGFVWEICYDQELLSGDMTVVQVSLFGNFIDTNVFYFVVKSPPVRSSQRRA